MEEGSPSRGTAADHAGQAYSGFSSIIIRRSSSLRKVPLADLSEELHLIGKKRSCAESRQERALCCQDESINVFVRHQPASQDYRSQADDIAKHEGWDELN